MIANRARLKSLSDPGTTRRAPENDFLDVPSNDNGSELHKWTAVDKGRISRMIPVSYLVAS